MISSQWEIDKDSIPFFGQLFLVALNQLSEPHRRDSIYPGGHIKSCDLTRIIHEASIAAADPDMSTSMRRSVMSRHKVSNF